MLLDTLVNILTLLHMPTKTTTEKDIPPNFAWAISMIVIIIALCTLHYSHTWEMSELNQVYTDLNYKVSRIEIKSDDTANQLMLSLENQYWEERFNSANIAEEAGFEGYRKMVLINPDLHVVRLSNLNGDELSVNYLTKGITPYSPY